MKIEKLHLAPAYQAVSDELRKHIVRGEIQPGAPLPIEAELAERFGVHRSTIREGLRRLEQEGLVRRQGKRLVVSVPTQGELAGAAERALRMRQVTYRDVWELASTLEPLCAELAAQRITADELAALEANLAQTEACVTTGQAPIALTIAFQTLVAEATHNEALQLARAPVSLLMRAGYTAIAPALPQSGARLLAAHRQVVAALRAGDAATAVDWTRKHLIDHRRGCEVAGLDMDQPVSLADSPT